MTDMEKALAYAQAIVEAPSRSMAKRINCLHEDTLAKALIEAHTNWQNEKECHERWKSMCAQVREAMELKNQAYNLLKEAYNLSQSELKMAKEKK